MSRSPRPTRNAGFDPTLIMFKDGKPAAQKFGAEPKARLVQWIQSVL